MINYIDTSDFVLKTKYDIHKLELEKKIPDTNGLVKQRDYDILLNKQTMILNSLNQKKKIPNVSNLATKTALNAVENKIPSVSSLVKKQTMTQKLLRLKRNLLIMIMINMLLLQSLILQLLMVSMQDQHKPI